MIAEVEPPERIDRLLQVLAEHGVLAAELGPGRLRLVTHLDVDDDGVERAVAALQAAARTT